MSITCRITDGWLPLPESALALTGWVDGDTVEIEVVEGVVLATRIEARPQARIPPPKRRSIGAPG